MGNLSTCTLIFRVIFMIINIIVMVIGATVLGIGIYLQVEATSGKYSYIVDNDAGPALLITSGLVTCILTLIGIFGAWLKSKCCLIFYSIVLAIIIVLQIAAGIVGFVYRDNAKDLFEEDYANRLTKAIEVYDSDSSAKKAIDTLQQNSKCCGVYAPEDWAENGAVINDQNGELPESCQCDVNNSTTTTCMEIEPFDYYYFDSNGTRVNATYDSENTVWVKGCYNDTISIIEGLAAAYGGVGIGVGIFEITILILAIGLVFCIVKSTQQYEVV